MEGKTVAIIPCTNQKASLPGPAREVWQGAHFQLTLAHAEIFYDEVLIMSYKYGFIGPDKIIEPYDKNVQYFSAKEKLLWWWQIRDDIKKLVEQKPALVAVYTGNIERKRLLREFARNGYMDVILPWDGIRIGQRMQKVYDGDPPFDPEKIGTPEYQLDPELAGPTGPGRPKEEEKVEDIFNLEWVDE